jgi:AbiTii
MMRETLEIESHLLQLQAQVRTVARVCFHAPVSRNQEALRVAEELLADIELRRLKASEIILKATRLARLVGQDDLLTFLKLEREGYPTDGSVNGWIGRADRWDPEGKTEGVFYPAPLSRIEATLQGQQGAIEALKGGGNYSGEYASIAGREHDQKITALARSIGTLSSICGAVVSTVYGLAMDTYHELLFSDLQATLFADTQGNVDGALAAASGSALEKIERVSDRLRDGDTESVSQALTTCRRLIDSCADHVFPGREDAYDMGNGLTLKVGSQNVLNRLQAYVHGLGVSKSRRDRLRRTLIDLYDRCSAGTHAEVTVQEARFVFLQTFVALGEVLTLGSNDADRALDTWQELERLYRRSHMGRRSVPVTESGSAHGRRSRPSQADGSCCVRIAFGVSHQLGRVWAILLHRIGGEYPKEQCPCHRGQADTGVVQQTAWGIVPTDRVRNDDAVGVRRRPPVRRHVDDPRWMTDADEDISRQVRVDQLIAPQRSHHVPQPDYQRLKGRDHFHRPLVPRGMIRLSPPVAPIGKPSRSRQVTRGPMESSPRRQHSEPVDVECLGRGPGKERRRTPPVDNPAAIRCPDDVGQHKANLIDAR